FNRVHVNVASSARQVAIVGHVLIWVPALEEMAYQLVFPVELMGVAACDVVDDRAERSVADLQEKVDVIRHPAVSVAPRYILSQRFRNEVAESLMIISVPEDRLFAVSPEHGVIDSSAVVH
ncbi:MAG: hypothetical protein V3U43_11025, partial [Pseudomonadales bacterium]